MKKIVLGRGATKRIVKRGTPIKRDGRQTVKKAERAKRPPEKQAAIPALAIDSFIKKINVDTSQRYVTDIGEISKTRVVQSVVAPATTQKFAVLKGFSVSDTYEIGAIPFVASVTADADGLLVVTTKYLVPALETVEIAAPGELSFETTEVVEALPNVKRATAIKTLATETALAYVPVNE